MFCTPTYRLGQSVDYFINCCLRKFWHSVISTLINACIYGDFKTKSCIIKFELSIRCVLIRSENSESCHVSCRFHCVFYGKGCNGFENGVSFGDLVRLIHLFVMGNRCNAVYSDV